MIGSDDVLACFVAGNVFTIEYVRAQVKRLRILIMAPATGSD